MIWIKTKIGLRDLIRLCNPICLWKTHFQDLIQSVIQNPSGLLLKNRAQVFVIQKILLFTGTETQIKASFYMLVFLILFDFHQQIFSFVRFPAFLCLSHSVAPSCCFGFPQNEIQMFFWSAGGERAEDRKGRGGTKDEVTVQSFSMHKEKNRWEILEYGAKVCEDGRLGA